MSIILEVKMANSTEKQKRPDFFKGVKAEFKKIIWPDKKTTFKQSVVVVTISVAVGILIAVLDYFIQFGVNFLTSL
jgi:preprotein translocase subunit SecE